MVAIAEVAHIPTHILVTACTDARRTATHHAQIIPAIFKAAEPLIAREDSILKACDIHPRLPAPPITPPAIEDVQELQTLIGDAAAQFKVKEFDRWQGRIVERAQHYPKVKVDPDAPRTIAEMLAKRDAANAR